MTDKPKKLPRHAPAMTGAEMAMWLLASPPIAAAKAVRTEHSPVWLLLIKKCPHCGKPHQHGGQRGPQPSGGHRVSHCKLGKDRRIVGKEGYIVQPVCADDGWARAQNKLQAAKEVVRKKAREYQQRKRAAAKAARPVPEPKPAPPKRPVGRPRKRKRRTVPSAPQETE